MKAEPKVRIRVTLKDYLSSINITTYQLGKWVDGVSSQTIYAVAGETRRPSLEVLEAIVNGLRAQGYSTTLNDLMQIEAREDDE